MRRSRARGFYAFLCVILLLTACGVKEPTWQEQYALGVRYLSEGNYEEAIIVFTAAIEIDPKLAPAYVGRGDAYILSGETAEILAAAQSDYEKALILDNTFVEVYQKLAQVYLTLEEPNKAAEILEQGFAVTGDETLGESPEDIQVSLPDPEPTSDRISDLLGKTMGDVVERYGEGYSADNYEGSTFIMYQDIGAFYFGTIVEYPDYDAIITMISWYSDEPLVGVLTGMMTYPELVAAVGEVAKEPEYSFNEFDNKVIYSSDFVYQGYRVSYIWLEDPTTTASVSVTIGKDEDIFETHWYEPDMGLITERFNHIGRNYLTEVLDIPADAGVQFANIQHAGGMLWSMDCYTPTDNGLRIFASFEFDPWSSRAAITPQWGGEFDAEFDMDQYDY